jgi:hypothetical protein
MKQEQRNLHTGCSVLYTGAYQDRSRTIAAWREIWLYNAALTRNFRFVVIDQLDQLEDERHDREHDQISYASKRLKQIV